MAFVDVNSELWRELASLAEDDGVTLYDAALQGNSSVIIYVCKSSGDGKIAGGVSSGDCSKLCKRLITFFAVEASRFGLSEEMRIEVSSSGINRNLRLQRHFMGAVGERVRLTLYGAETSDDGKKVANRGARTIRGTLKAADELNITVEEEGKDATGAVVPYASIKSARIDFNFENCNGLRK